MSNQDQQNRQQERANTPPNTESARHGVDSQPRGNADGAIKQKLKEDVQDAKHEVGVMAREKAEAGQHRLAGEADTLSSAIDAAAANLDEHDREGLARYARQMSSKLSAAAEQLEGRSVSDLVDDAKRLAHDNPALFMLGSVAVGFGLSRFFKASEKHDRYESSNSYGTQDSHESTHRNDDFPSTPPMRRPDNGMTEPFTTMNPPLSGNGRDTL